MGADFLTSQEVPIDVGGLVDIDPAVPARTHSVRSTKGSIDEERALAESSCYSAVSKT